MISAINLSDNTTNFKSNIKLASNKTLARLHYIKFLRAEDQFFKATKEYEQQTEDFSLKTMSSFGKAVRNFCKMAYERLTSAYYFNKK